MNWPAFLRPFVAAPDAHPYGGTMTIEIKPESMPAWLALVADDGGDHVATFARMMGLYRLALDARRAGKAVGAAESGDWLEVEWAGFGGDEA